MAFSHTIGGMTFTEASFQGNAYADETTGFPKALEKMAEHVANAYHGTSTDSLTVGAGAKALTISNTNGQVPAFAPGMPVRIARTSDPAGVWMQGEITAWDGATGIATINVDATKSSGSFSDWSIVIGGHLTTASGASPLAVSQGGTGANSGKAALANLTPGVSGIIEANNNFIDAVIFGPALDPVDWSLRTAAPTSSLMLATIEDSGIDGLVRIWDLTSDNLTGATPLATVTLASAKGFCIAAFMGCIAVGTSGAGVKFVDPHDGTWGERTIGWPRALSTGSVPAIVNNTVKGIAAGPSDQPAHDPRTGGPMPTFAITYASGGTYGSVIKDDGQVWDDAGSAATYEGICGIDGGRLYQAEYNGGSLQILWQSKPISMIGADAWTTYGLTRKDAGAWVYGFGLENALSIRNGKFATANWAGLNVGHTNGENLTSSNYISAMAALITRTYNTGMLLAGTVFAGLANSRTADRGVYGNTLTEIGTVTEESADGASGELKAYSGFSSTKYLKRTYDADFDFSGANLTVSLWFKGNGWSAAQKMVARDDPADVVVPFWSIQSHGTNKNMQFYYYSSASATGNVCQTDASVALDDGEWHQFVVVQDGGQGTIKCYLDGIYHDTETHGATGNYTNGSAELWIGEHPIPAQSSPADNTELALLRISQAVATEAQIRQMHAAERPMFEVGAKCQLQSGTTDNVLDVDIDPITSKIAVTQEDDATIWDGLAIDSEPARAGGAAWEHNKLYGDDRVEINDANLYATIAAKNLREDLEILRGLKAGLTAGIDLSTAKAWIYFKQSSNTIYASYGIKAITNTATGKTLIEFAVPFKAGDATSYSSPVSYVPALSFVTQTGNDHANINNVGNRTIMYEYRNSAASLTNHQYPACMAFFGELENE